MNSDLISQIQAFYQTADPDIFPTSISFSQGQKLVGLIKKYKPKRILQIGCAFGVSSLWIESVALYPHEHVIVEIFPENIGKTKKLLDKFQLIEHVKFIQGFSQVELGQLFKQQQSYDLVLHDGDNKFDGLMSDIFFIHRILSLNGIYIQRNLWNPSIREAVSFVLSNYHYKVLELNITESLLLKNKKMRRKKLQKLGYSKLNDLIVLQKVKKDERVWDHFIDF